METRLETTPAAGHTLFGAWAEELRDAEFRREALLTGVVLGAALATLSHFLLWVEHRPGVVLPDPLLDLLPPRDLAWAAFLLIYAGIIGGVALLAKQPRLLLVAVQAYVVMLVLRMAAMSVVPLDACPGMIPLEDPLVQRLGSGVVLTKDLFFSGHTSTFFLLFLAVPGGRTVKALFLAGTVGVAACVLWQHVHYSVDVLAAPVFAYASYRIALRLNPPA